MRVTAGLDSGPVCLRPGWPIAPEDTYGTPGRAPAEARGRAAGGALDERPGRTEQDEGGVTYAEKITAADRGWIPASGRRARAGGAGADPPYRRLRRAGRRRRLGVWGPGSGAARPPGPGELALDGRCRCWAAPTARSSCDAVQPPGRRAMRGADFVRGRREPARARSRRAAGVPPVRAYPSSGGCSNRAPTPTGPCAEAAGLGRATGRWPRGSPTAPCSAGTLDHVTAALISRPPERLDPRCSPRCASGCYSCCSWTGSPTTRPCTRASSWPSAAAAAAPGWSTRCCAGPRARAGRMLAGARRRHPGRRRVTHSVPQWLAELWWPSWARARPGRCWPPSTAPAESALRVNTLVAARDEVMAGSCRWPRTPRRPARGRSCSRRPSTSTARSCGAAGAIMPQSRGSMAGRRGARARGPGSGCSTCARPRGQDDPPRRADGGRGGAGGGRAPPRPARGAGRDPGADAAPLRGVEVADARAPAGRSPALTACSSIPRAAAWARCSRGPTCAGAPARSGSPSSLRSRHGS